MQSLRRMSSESGNNPDVGLAGCSSHESYATSESSHLKSASTPLSQLIKKEAPITKPPRKRNQLAQEEPMYENAATVLKNPCNNSSHEAKPAGQASIEIHDIIQSNLANLYPTVDSFTDNPLSGNNEEDDVPDLYDEPMERMDAWKTLGLGDHTPPKTYQLTDVDYSEHSTSCDDPGQHLYCKLSSLHIHGSSSTIMADDESDYSHLQHIMPSSSQMSSNNQECTYATNRDFISSKDASLKEIQPSNSATETSTVKSSSESHQMTRYENVLMPEIKSNTDCSLRSPRSGRAKAKPIVASDPALPTNTSPYISRRMPSSHPDIENDGIEHVMQNDAVYAQVLRKSTKI